MKRPFICYFYFVGWWAWSLGFHIDIHTPNIELHIPFGFIRIGWPSKPGMGLTTDQARSRLYGWDEGTYYEDLMKQYEEGYKLE